MRKHGKWLTQADERILEFLHEEGNHPPSAIQSQLVERGVDLDYHPEYISSRCREIAKYGLVINVGAGTYSITDLGKEFLNGDLDAGTLSAE